MKTLAQISAELRGMVAPDYDQLHALADAIDFHLSQPQPVAQGEAVAESCKLCSGRGERTADGSNGRRVRCKTCDGTGKIALHATPTIPAGHRVVPVDAEFVVPDGWVFYSADFSCVVSGRTLKGQIMLKRDPSGEKWWHSLTEEQQEETDLYVRGNGVTIQSAIDEAASKIAASPSAWGV
jgi:hypothetical protein